MASTISSSKGSTGSFPFMKCYCSSPSLVHTNLASASIASRVIRVVNTISFSKMQSSLMHRPAAAAVRRPCASPSPCPALPHTFHSPRLTARTPATAKDQPARSIPMAACSFSINLSLLQCWSSRRQNLLPSTPNHAFRRRQDDNIFRVGHLPIMHSNR
ncbi:hypothetical protein SCHPADRAFT_457678 [Schizopora paradoxa]|uniref:Uncharacterized protein n=1 Tax=Schizopora paradoxa TaxID=27342 RepID=A0A0H2RJC6_9AGAM|nr:hypothetical protein SCHPADRAFT_457678 [Schizopora paradoxa]